MPASVEKTYADALFTLIADEKGDDKSAFYDSLSELEAINAVISETPDFVKLLGTPTVCVDEKLLLLEKAFKDRTSGYVYNFLRLLTVKGRMPHFRGIYRDFRVSYNDRFGIVEVTVTSALPLSDASRGKITARMEEITGKTVLLSEKVDKSIIGGIMLDYGNTRLDGSVKTRLADLKKDISNIIA